MNRPSNGTAKEYFPCRFLYTSPASQSAASIWLTWLARKGFVKVPFDFSTISWTVNSSSEVSRYAMTREQFPLAVCSSSPTAGKEIGVQFAKDAGDGDERVVSNCHPRMDLPRQTFPDR